MVELFWCFHSYASRIGSKKLPKTASRWNVKFPFIRFTNWKQGLFSLFGSIADRSFPFIRFTNWKQACYQSWLRWRLIVSIHTLHELEARRAIPVWWLKLPCFHSYASRIGSKQTSQVTNEILIWWFPFIRFTNWKQESLWMRFATRRRSRRFHSYASRIGSKAGRWVWDGTSKTKSFHSYASRIGSKFGGRVDTRVSVCGFHSYASRIGSKINATKSKLKTECSEFPFIRFTNWKQEASDG